MRVHLVDGTYELFRQYHGQPPRQAPGGREVAATVGVVTSVLSLVADGATHVGVATDHVIESFRNDLWPGYKTGEGLPHDLLSQFPLVEAALAAFGFAVWPMVELEADDALASAAAVAADDRRVEQVLVCTPDKDLAQTVRGRSVVQLDRRKRTLVDEDGVRARFGVAPRSIPDWLALVGDSADGFPGLPGWGKRSASLVLAHYQRLEDIPEQAEDWDAAVRARVRGPSRLAETLAAERELALLFRELATLRIDRSLLGDVDDLRWRGPGPELEAMCAELGAPQVAERARALVG